MPRYRISHHTGYSYSSPVIQSTHLLHLAPRRFGNQTVVNHGLEIVPKPAWRSDRSDYFGNPVSLVSLEDEHRALSVSAVSEIEVKTVPPTDYEASPDWEDVARQGSDLPPEILQYTCASPFIRPAPNLDAFAREVFKPGLPLLEGARRLMAHIYETFTFDNTSTDVATPLDQVLAQKSGVCQDFAHLQIAAMRTLGLPARYVSGYILTHPPEGQPKLEGTDASHAWLSVWSPTVGWVDFDPTNNLVNSDEHIAIAVGRDFDDVSPISGVLLGGGQHTVSVAVDVRQL